MKKNFLDRKLYSFPFPWFSKPEKLAPGAFLEQTKGNKFVKYAWNYSSFYLYIRVPGCGVSCIDKKTYPNFIRIVWNFRDVTVRHLIPFRIEHDPDRFYSFRFFRRTLCRWSKTFHQFYVWIPYTKIGFHKSGKKWRKFRTF